MAEAEIIARRRKWTAEQKAALLAEVKRTTATPLRCSTMPSFRVAGMMPSTQRTVLGILDIRSSVKNRHSLWLKTVSSSPSVRPSQCDYDHRVGHGANTELGLPQEHNGANLAARICCWQQPRQPENHKKRAGQNADYLVAALLHRSALAQ